MNNESKYDPAIHHRRSIRLQGYDYSQAGAYFVTICTHNRECLFGAIVGARGGSPIMHLNDAGQVVADEWVKTGTIREEIELDEWVVMPNHFHAIVIIIPPNDCRRGDRRVAHDYNPARRVAHDCNCDRPLGHEGILGPSDNYKGDPPVAPTGPRPKSIGAIMAGFKSAVTKRINEINRTPGRPLWQRNYYEHIIRDELELNRIRDYTRNNPSLWHTDKLYGWAKCRPNETRESTVEYGLEDWMI